MNDSTPTGAESVQWNLQDLYSSVSGLKTDLSDCSTDAETFSETYRGHVAELDADRLAGALDALASIQDRSGRAFTYAYLWWSTNTGDAERGALLQEVRERYTQISTRLLFFEIEWAHVDDDVASRLLSEARLAPYRHFLELQRAMRPHLMSEPEEKLMAEKSVTGRSAWNRFFDEHISELRFTLDGAALTQQEVLAKLHDSDRDTRRAAAASFTEGLSKEARALAFVFNTILADKATDDRLRRYDTWVSDRNLSNEVDDETVAALISAVTGGYDIVARYYGIKRRLLGLETLFDYDRYAPVGQSDRRVSWAEATSQVTDAYSDFHPEMGKIVEQFIDGEWIDAALAPGKRGGAFSHGAVPSAHPYILLNFTGRVRDVQTLAHELGHGVHQYLSREQGIFHASTPLTTAETASVFGEMLTFQRLLAAEQDPANRLAMLMGKIDDTFATVFRQVSMNRFEERIHGYRRERGELSVDTFSALWIETQEAMFAGSVTLTDDYRIWWSYIPHFLHTPGYVYAYAFGELLVLALFEKYQSEGEAFAGRYFELLKAGGSDYPHVLLARMGIDLQDHSFWQGGVRAIGRLVDQAEALSRADS